MNYTITKDRSQLVLTVDEDERALLCELGEAIHRDMTMHEFFERLVCNSELWWVSPAATGDLTDAPMLGLVEYDDDSEFGYRVVERWAWMSYAVRSLLEELRDKGVAVLVGGPVT